MVFLSILEFSLRSTCAHLPSAMSSTTATMETTSVEAASKARPPAGGKAPDIAAVIKAAERAGACTWLWVKRRVPASVEGMAMAEAAVVEVVAAEVVAIDDRSATGDVRVVIVDHGPAVPVVSPVMPAPPK